MRSFHQLVIGAGRPDAITSMAFEMRAELRELGPSDIHALHRDPGVAEEVRRLDELPPGHPWDVLIYHASFGDPRVTRLLRGRSEQLVVVYHNISPSEYFLDIDPQFAAGLEWGRHELRLLRDRVALAVAVSEYNAADLRALGYPDPHVAPMGLRADRLNDLEDDPAIIRELERRMPEQFLVNVSQMLPHKRQHVLVQALHVLQWIEHRSIGLVVIGTPRSVPYVTAMRETVRRLRIDNVWFATDLDDRAAATVLRRASVFATASAHEGLGIPPLEAMSLGRPVVATSAAAAPETLGDAALILPPDAGPLLFAAAIGRLVDDEHLRTHLVRRGAARVRNLNEAAEPRRWIRLLQEMLR